LRRDALLETRLPRVSIRMRIPTSRRGVLHIATAEASSNLAAMTVFAMAHGFQAQLIEMYQKTRDANWR